MGIKKYIKLCALLDKEACYHKADKIEDLIIRYAQTMIDPQKIEKLNLNNLNQQADPSKYYDAGSIDGNFNINPNSPPQIVNVKDDSGISHTILVLHGSQDGNFLISDSSGNVVPADKKEFDKWRLEKGYTNYPWISCYNGNVANTGNMNRLMKGTSKFELSTALLPGGTTHLLIKSQ